MYIHYVLLRDDSENSSRIIALRFWQRQTWQKLYINSQKLKKGSINNHKKRQNTVKTIKMSHKYPQQWNVV